MPSQTPSADDTETVMNDWAGHRPTDSNLVFSWARKPWSDATLVGLLLLVTLSCYVNTLTNGFVYDDLPQILQNPYVKSWRFLPEIFGTTVWSFVGQAGTTNYYRPLMTFSFLVLWKIFGPVAFGFHLFSVVVHAAVVTMVFYAGARVFRERSVAWIAALLFAVHPIHTEAVSWIAALPDLEAAFFLLLAVWLLAEEGRMDWKKHALVMASFALALLSKEPSLMLVPLAITFEHGVSYGRQTTSLSAKITRYVPVSLVGVSYLFLRIVLFGKVAPVLQHPQITWPQTIYSGFALVLNYAKLLVWPNRLSAFHVFHARTSLFDPHVLGGVAVVLLGILGIFALRMAPAAAFALFWIVVTLAPVLNARWMASNVLTERYLYLPSVGFCWLLAWCGVRLWESKRTLALSPSARRVVLGLLLVTTIILAAVRVITRNRDWQSDFALYTRTLQTDPDAHIIRSNLAGVYFELHDYERAGQEWEAALAGKPDNVVTMNALGTLYTQDGRYAEAAAMFQRAFAAKPLWGNPHYNYALLLRKTGDHSQSLVELRKAIELAPLNYQAHQYYAEELAFLGQYAEAEVQFRKSLDLEPSDSALRGLAALYLKTNQTELAETTLRRLVAASPYDGASHLQLARLLEANRNRDEARTQYEAVLVTDPANPEARSALKRLQNQ